MGVSFEVRNALSHSSDHSNFMFFFSNFCVGCIKSGMSQCSSSTIIEMHILRQCSLVL